MSIYEKDGWNHEVCSFCGNSKPHTIFIKICISLPDEDSPFPFIETNLCKECWDEQGIQPTLEIVKELQEA